VLYVNQQKYKKKFVQHLSQLAEQCRESKRKYHKVLVLAKFKLRIQKAQPRKHGDRQQFQ